MKRLLDDNEMYTPEASALSKKASQAIEDLAKPYLDEGYSIQDIFHIIRGPLDLIAAKHIMHRRIGKMRAAEKVKKENDHPCQD